MDLREFLAGEASEVAPRLLGCYLVRKLKGQNLIGRIVETEAYDQADEASHTYKGYSKRSATMFGPAGHLYVYFTYGMHYCCNVVVGDSGHGAGVLLRALEPIEGEDIMSQNRHNLSGISLTNGPAKLSQALKIDKYFDGHDLRQEPIKLIINEALLADNIVQTTRIGIAKAKDMPWRFYEKDNPYVSKL